MSRYLGVKRFGVSTYKPLCPKVVFDFDPKKTKRTQQRGPKKGETRKLLNKKTQKEEREREREREKKQDTMFKVSFHFFFVCG